MFNLKKPCKDCPFLRDSTMRDSLQPGRLADIADDLQSNDGKVFTCHKTIDYSQYGHGEPTRGLPGEEMCFGSLIYLQKIGRPHVSQRLAYSFGMLSPQEVTAQADIVVDEKDVEDDKEAAKRSV